MFHLPHTGVSTYRLLFSCGLDSYYLVISPSPTCIKSLFHNPTLRTKRKTHFYLYSISILKRLVDRLSLVAV